MGFAVGQTGLKAYVAQLLSFHYGIVERYFGLGCCGGGEGVESVARECGRSVDVAQTAQREDSLDGEAVEVESDVVGCGTVVPHGVEHHVAAARGGAQRSVGGAAAEIHMSGQGNRGDIDLSLHFGVEQARLDIVSVGKFSLYYEFARGAVEIGVVGYGAACRKRDVARDFGGEGIDAQRVHPAVDVGCEQQRSVWWQHPYDFGGGSRCERA